MIFNFLFCSITFSKNIFAFLQIFVLKPPHKPRSELNTTHKCVSSFWFPTNNFGAESMSLTEFFRFNIIEFNFSE